MCVVAEHYPALSFQIRQLLVMHHSSGVRRSLILDIFSLDTVTEFLSSPLRFLNYLDLRALHGDNIQGHTELSLLALHLHQNLWPIGDADVTYLHDDVCAPIEAAMNTRRLGMPGSGTPLGILTALDGTIIRRVMDALGRYATPPAIDLGLSLLKGSSVALQELDSHIGGTVRKATRDNTIRTSTLISPEIPVGLSVQAVPVGHQGDGAALRQSCTAHKYTHKAEEWVGVEVGSDGAIGTIETLHYPWVRDAFLERVIRMRSGGTRVVGLTDNQGTHKIGRNDPCPCGSGKKFKRCCGP